MSPIEIAILAMVAVALLLQACFVLAVVIGMAKVSRILKQEVADVRSSVMPLLNDTRDLVNNLKPKIESTADDVSTILKSVRSQTANVETASTEIVERVRRQSARLDTMVSGLMDSADRTGAVVADRVGKPLRKLAGFVASAKAVVETLRTPRPEPNTARARGDQDMFV
jgi:methyl-accepting chemotaxis protein